MLAHVPSSHLQAPDNDPPGLDWVYVPSIASWVWKEAAVDEGRISYDDGSYYLGDRLAKFARHGYGKLILPDGGYYEGQWK